MTRLNLYGTIALVALVVLAVAGAGEKMGWLL